MKKFINYFYNLNIENVRMIDDNYYFNHDDNSFVLYEVKDVYFDYDALFDLDLTLRNFNGCFYQIIPNKYNDIVTVHSDRKYILMVSNDILEKDRDFDYFDVIDTHKKINLNNKTVNRLNRSNWDSLWQNKIDYFENFIEHNFNKYPVLNKYYDYFIGMAENAVLYYKDTLADEKPGLHDELVISHKRIDKDFTFKQLHNPMELVIDHSSRDLSEYLKMIFLDNSYHYDKIIQYVNQTIFSQYGARLLISRLLFPSFFFDMFKKMVDNKLALVDITRLIDIVSEYEIYIYNIYKLISTKYQIPEIEWLKKVDYSSTLTTPNTSGTSFISIDSMPSLSVTSIMLQ